MARQGRYHEALGASEGSMEMMPHESTTLPPHASRVGEGGLRCKNIYKDAKSDAPLVSVFTVVYNGEAYLEKTIRSVLEQGYENIEYIIVDGGSTDRTLAIVKRYESDIDYWVSEPDGGIYDAMNKGLTLCRGDIIGIINADDWYRPDAVEASVRALMHSGRDYSYGTIKKVPSGLVVRPMHPLEQGRIFQGMMYPHISAFIRKEVYDAVGPFNTAYKIAADFDMALRIHLAGYRAVVVDSVLAEVFEGGVSADAASRREYRMIAIANGKPALAAYATFIKQMMKYYVFSFLPSGMISFIFRLKKSRFQYER
jgi:glycosyltransferase involved in cell wall biosynthesis